ncbi:cupin domain-containing protein [Flavobacterium sp.]|uniref:cupin domain-containing protein n=1 Tax=Flavobacterium sp. TaxID=239 RepID=UPI00286D6B22|nr:cupin domain-containing protein [Flavobacterium sp.]
MERKKFLLTTALAIPALLVGQVAIAQKPKRPNKGFVVKANESRFGEKTLLFGNCPNDIKVSQKDTNGDLTIFEYIGNQKGGPALHIHPNQDEIFFIVQGEYLFQVGDKRHNLKSGDTIFLPRTVPHAFAQLSDTGKMFFLFQPSGKMEDFFRLLGDPNFKPTPEEGDKISLEHGMKVVGPPLQF